MNRNLFMVVTSECGSRKFHNLTLVGITEDHSVALKWGRSASKKWNIEAYVMKIPFGSLVKFKGVIGAPLSYNNKETMNALNREEQGLTVFDSNGRIISYEKHKHTLNGIL